MSEVEEVSFDLSSEICVGDVVSILAERESACIDEWTVLEETNFAEGDGILRVDGGGEGVDGGIEDALDGVTVVSEVGSDGSVGTVVVESIGVDLRIIDEATEEDGDDRVEELCTLAETEAHERKGDSPLLEILCLEESEELFISASTHDVFPGEDRGG